MKSILKNQIGLDSLQPGKMLNDEVVNSYLSLIERSDTLCLSSLLVTKYLNSEYKSSEKWFKNKGIYKNYDLSSFRQIITPICHKKHWTLLIINIKNKSYTYYNSATPGLTNHELNLILTGIFHIFKHLKLADFKKNEYYNIPKQTNNVDCGMFICLYARYYLANDEFTFNQNMINDFRSTFKIELEKKKLFNITGIDSRASAL